jgi:hypothetical protein
MPCIIDSEAVCCGDDGVPSFDRIRYRRHDASVFLYAFDLIELNGDDLLHNPLVVRKATLAPDLAVKKCRRLGEAPACRRAWRHTAASPALNKGHVFEMRRAPWSDWAPRCAPSEQR